MAKHIYIVDTCVVLHDPQAMFRFAENDIYLPLAVIDDLDRKKTTPGPVGWAAREVFRFLDLFAENELTGSGVVVNDQGGRLFVYNPDGIRPTGEIPDIQIVESDNAIILAYSQLKSLNPATKVTIVTKDTGLRIRAVAYGCEVENYRSDLLDDRAYTGVRDVTIENATDWSALWGCEIIKVEKLSKQVKSQLNDLGQHEFVLFNWGESCCPTKRVGEGELRVIRDKAEGGAKKTFMGIHAKNLGQQMALEVLADPFIQLVSICGSAGTGKTMLSLAVALEMIDTGIYERIIFIKPIVPVGGKDIGALPGDKFEKLAAWLGPARDNIEQLVRTKAGRSAGGSFEEMVEEGIIEVEAMAYIQGRSIPRSVVIVDESQNLTARETRMVVERCGNGSKVILLGDLSQVENSYLDARSNGLAHAMNGSKRSELCATVTLSKVERSPLAAVASIIFGAAGSR